MLIFYLDLGNLYLYSRIGIGNNGKSIYSRGFYSVILQTRDLQFLLSFQSRSELINYININLWFQTKYQSLVPDEITLKLSRIPFYPPHDLICISFCRNPTILCIVDLLQEHYSQTASSSNQTVPDVPGYRNTFGTFEIGKSQIPSLSSPPKKNTPQI